MNKKKNHLSFVKELLQANVVMMEGSSLHNYKQVLTKNFNAHVSSEVIDAELPNRDQHVMLKFIKGDKNVNGIQYFNSENILCEKTNEGDDAPAKDPKDDEERVLVLNMTGPVTRCGGMCSYSSMDFRDIMLEYAKDEKTVGMVLVTDTPGGVCFAMHDFEQGMEAWNEAGKRSIQFIDGASLSAGVAIGSQCQKVIAMNKKDEVGCIGAMLAGWTTQDGTHDSDGNRYIDITATQTPDKNSGIRAAANGDYKELQKEVNDCCTDFLSLLEKCRPQITEEQKTGKIFYAGDVIGTLVDGIGDFDSALEYARTGKETWKTNPDEKPEKDSEEQPEIQPEEQPEDKSTEDSNEQLDEQPDNQPEGESVNRTDDTEQIEGQPVEQNDNAYKMVESVISSRFEDMLKRIEALNLQMQQHKQMTDERIKELEQEKDVLQAEKEKLQKELLKSNEELNSIQMEVPSPAIPATRQVQEKKESAPSRINDSMTPQEKLAAWNNRGNQIAKSRMA